MSLVPDDFPVLPGGAVSGLQQKFSVCIDVDGRLREPTSRMSWRERDHARCVELLAWSLELLREKRLKPKYELLSPDELVARLKVNLLRDVGLPPSYCDWVLAGVAAELGSQGPDRSSLDACGAA